MEDLLAACAIEGHLLSPSKLDAFGPVEPIDYTRVTPLIENKKASSRQFLNEALKPSNA